MDRFKKINGRLLSLVLPALLLSVTAAAADRLDLSNPDDRLRTSIKLNCSLENGAPGVYWWAGRMYSRVQGERDRHLFDVEAMSVRQCETRVDPVRGVCYRSISRELVLYLDPATGEVVRRWQNPWTGAEVEVLQVANDPPGRIDTCSRDEQGQPTGAGGGGSYIEKDGWLLSGGGAARLFYTNPMGGDFQEYVGGTYHAMEFLTSATRADDLLDGNAPAIRDRVISWGRVSQWLPWMEMGSRPGVVFFHTAGLRLDHWDELPERMKREINANFPLYREAPPLDYPRPRETSWTVAKDHIDRKRAAE